MKSKRVRILGTRGIPGAHGGFETFAEELARYLVSKGWDVTVYCQQNGGAGINEEIWRDIRLVHIPVNPPGSVGTIIFDWKSTLHASQEGGLVLTLGYNTAIFSILYRLRGHVNLINMDGIEWRRKKWTPIQRVWLYLNEHLARWLGNHLIADHPEIKAHHAGHVSSDKITMIPYGAHCIQNADAALLAPFSLAPNQYAIVIARAEPENSVLEIVKAFSRRPRGLALVVLGRYEPDKNAYHKEVIDAASNEVRFLGPLYDKPVVNSLRFYSRLYIHGHTVGGTNPSLVEALGASLPVLAHDNIFNRWVAGSGAHYFRDLDACASAFDELLHDEGELNVMRINSSRQYREKFTWVDVLGSYERLLEKWVV